MLFIRNLKPPLNVQSDSIKAKLFIWPWFDYYIVLFSFVFPLFSFALLFIIMYIDYSCPLYFSLHRPSLYDNDNLKLSKRQFLLVFVIKYIFIRKNTIQTLVEVQKGGMVGTVVRSLLSDHKVPSLIQALLKFEYLCDLLFHLS